MEHLLFLCGQLPEALEARLVVLRTNQSIFSTTQSNENIKKPLLWFIPPSSSAPHCPSLPPQTPRALLTVADDSPQQDPRRVVIHIGEGGGLLPQQGPSGGGGGDVPPGAGPALRAHSGDTSEPCHDPPHTPITPSPPYPRPVAEAAPHAAPGLAPRPDAVHNAR